MLVGKEKKKLGRHTNKEVRLAIAQKFQKECFFFLNGQVILQWHYNQGRCATPPLYKGEVTKHHHHHGLGFCCAVEGFAFFFFFA